MHPQPIGHISLGVSSYHSSKRFYDAVLPLIGLQLVYDSVALTNPGSGPRTLGYGPDAENEVLNIFEYGPQASAAGPGSHIAFNADSRSAVDGFYEAALRSGGKSNGEPGLRQHYGKNYYAAFVVDPDGWRLEIVCRKAGDVDEDSRIAGGLVLGAGPS